MMCRKLGLVGSLEDVVDPAWRRKVEEEGFWHHNDSYVLSDRRVQVPRGLKVIEEIMPGQIMGQDDPRFQRLSGPGDWVRIHVCTREMGRAVGDLVNADPVGTKKRGPGWEGYEGRFKFIRVPQAKLPEIQAYLSQDKGKK